MDILTAEQILSADDLVKERVEVPEWGGDLYIKTMSGEERDSFEENITKTKGKKVDVNFKNIRAKLVVKTACSEDGVLLFNDSQVEALGKKSAKALDRCFSKAQELNGLSPTDVEDLAKNSEPDQSGHSTTD